MKNKIQELRQEHHVTQAELADQLQVSRQTIISLERGKYNASLMLAHRLATYFNTTIEDIFTFEEE
ncbi:helix-turn-helix transcriptional regulator [Eupransor demetentiae]|uniref:XRE-family HTH domain (XRE) n=1 Tax=Eupransor demetentiae TaxID=3109584 RepID=A0ABM9N2V1_9LACO|nr:DNA-binding transcriptional regulator [Lactobacillaceae bacterium LMG 33000]